MRKKKQSLKAAIFWRITISMVGIALILLALINFGLFIFGETTTASFTTRRYGGERVGAVSGKRYTWYVDYTFTAEDGKTYEGHMTRLGGAMSVTFNRTIYYFPFVPFLNTPEDTAKPNLGQLAMISAGAFCLVVMNPPSKKKEGNNSADKLDD